MLRLRTLRIFFLLLLAGSFLFPHLSYATETTAHYGLLMDGETGQVLWSKNGDTPMAPASMSKLMTLYVIFEKLKEGQLKHQDKVFVSKNAWEKGGAASGSSTMFANPSSFITVEDALKAIIVFSANDACIAMAETISGSEENFAKLMNQKAMQLHLTTAHFINATGWPHPEEKISAHDLAKLGRLLALNFPEYYPLFKQKKFTWNHITQPNRNDLLFKDATIDGLKTGHTAESLFGIALSASREGKRRILVLNGLKTHHERIEEGKRLMNWAFNGFAPATLVYTKQILATPTIEDGAQPHVPVGLQATPVIRLLPYPGAAHLDVVIDQKQCHAPIVQGQVMGQLKINIEGGVEETLPLVALESVNKKNIVFRAFGHVKYFINTKILAKFF